MNFFAGNICLNIRNEVLDVIDGLSLLGNPLRRIGRRVVAHQEPVKVFVADVENLKKRAELVNLRHREYQWMFLTQALATLRRHPRLVA